MLREVIVKIGLNRIDIQEEIIVEVLLDSRATGLVISSEFARKQRFKLKKIERPIYVRNMDGTLNKEELIENIVEVNIYYQRHRKRMEIDVIGKQKQNVILEMLWLAHHNLKIDQRIEEVKMIRYLKECKKQQRLKQEKLGWQKQKEKEKREEAGKKQEKKEEKKKRKNLRKNRRWRLERQQRNRRFGMRKKKQQSQKKKQESWFQKSSIDRSTSLVRKLVNRCPQESFGIMQQI